MKKLFITLLLLASTTGLVSSATAAPVQSSKEYKKFNLKILYPEARADWSLVLKTYNDYVRLIYLSTKDECMVSISEEKVNDQLTKTIQNSREKVKADNNITYYFDPWADSAPGGTLKWIVGSHYLKMDSTKLSKEEMINLAKTVR